MGRAHALYEGVHPSPGLFPHLLAQSVVPGLPISIVQLIAVPMAWPTTELGRHCDHAFDQLLGDSLLVAHDVGELRAVRPHRPPFLIAERIGEHEVCLVATGGATRSFMLPVGLEDSSLAMMRAEPAGTTRRSATRGVLPMASRTCRLPEGLTLAPLHRVAGPDAVGPLGGHPVPAPAAVRRSRGAPASRTTPVAACSLRLPLLQTDPGVRSHRGAPSHRDGAANAAPRARTPRRAPRESRHAPAALARLRTRLRPS